jgi:hypothetical protein
MDPPETVAKTIRKAMDDWVDDHNKQQEFEALRDQIFGSNT